MLTGSQELGLYLAIGFVMGCIATWLFYRPGCPTRGEAFISVILWMAFGPVGIAGAILFSPIWLPFVVYDEIYEGSKLDRAVRAWFKKPLCKKL